MAKLFLTSFSFSFILFLLYALTSEASASQLFRKRKSPPKGQLPRLESQPQPIASLPFDHINSITARLELYIRENDPSAVFCEMKANREVVAKLEVFDRLVPTLIEILQMSSRHKMFGTRTAASLVSSVINAFIHFNVNVIEAVAFQNILTLQMFVSNLKSLKRFPLAFFILLQDSYSISQLNIEKTTNFYAVNHAILLLNNPETRIEILRILYNNFGVATIDSHQISRRLFRDSPDNRLCLFLLSRGFAPLDYPTIYRKCRFPVHHPKWDYFGDIYGHEIIQEFLQSDQLIVPQKDPNQFRFPFQVVPLDGMDHPRWELYSRAFGDQIVHSYKLQLLDK